MNNSYLDSLCKLTLAHNFLGVRPRDCLPNRKIIKKPYSMIINLDKSSEPGSHFVLIYHDSKKLYYFDSYGFAPMHQEILNFWKKQKCSMDFNKQTIQAEDSYFCGFFCLGYLLAKDRNITNDDFLNLFNKQNLNSNDLIVEKFIIESVSLL